MLSSGATSTTHNYTHLYLQGDVSRPRINCPCPSELCEKEKSFVEFKCQWEAEAPPTSSIFYFAPLGHFSSQWKMRSWRVHLCLPPLPPPISISLLLSVEEEKEKKRPHVVHLFFFFAVGQQNSTPETADRPLHSRMCLGHNYKKRIEGMDNFWVLLSIANV